MAKRKTKWLDTGLGCAVIVLIGAAVGLPVFLLVVVAIIGTYITYSQWKAQVPKKAEARVTVSMGVSRVTEKRLSQHVTTPTIEVKAGVNTITAIRIEELPQKLGSSTSTSSVANHLTSTPPDPVPKSVAPAKPPAAVNTRANRSTSMSVDTPVSVAPSTAKLAENPVFRIPEPPGHYGEAKWIPDGETVTVAGIKLPGGFLYIGTRLGNSRRQTEPSLIDPSLPVAERGNYALRQMDYWPSYAGITPEARRAYLNWLAGGRKDSDADIGFVFLFFYGLERRVLIDSAKDPELRSEWPAIRQELLRLIAIYADGSYSFRSYATSLLAWLSLASVRDKTYLKTVPHYDRSGELPFAIRLALGQAAMDKAPIPCALALAWTKLHPTTNFRMPAVRCKDEFNELFAAAYQQAYGDGLVIARNRTKLKLVHQPASAAFGGEFQSVALGEIPDVSVLTAPIKKLQDLAEQVTKELDSYSRFLSRNPDKRTSLEGVLLLPPVLWPNQVRTGLSALQKRVGHGAVAMKFEDMLSTLNAQGALSKEQTLSLARALESLDIGMEPDVMGGARQPKPADMIVLFGNPRDEVTSRSTSAYKASALTLQLASAVANADGTFSDGEFEHLKTQISSWVHLTKDHQRRLLAHLQLLRVAPVSLTSLRSKLDAFDDSAKQAVASFLASVAQADGIVSPDEVKFLEKVYKALGVDTSRVFTELHAAASGKQTPGVASPSSSEQRTGFKLDTERIASLQRDTAAVTSMLAEIFKEDDVPEVPIVDAPIPETNAASLLGLDDAHSTMARMLMSRVQWTREELGDVAADLDLMLDGALETLNEAAFDVHDMPFTEGDDAITVNPELLEKLAA